MNRSGAVREPDEAWRGCRGLCQSAHVGRESLDDERVLARHAPCRAWRVSRRSSVGFGAGLASLFLASAAFGQEQLRLSWDAPADCPSAEDVRSATLRGVRAHGGAHADVLEAEARVTQVQTGDGPGWRVHLVTRRGSFTGEREIEAATCDGVAEATAVVLALALVPAESASDGDTTAQPDPGPPEPDAPRRGAPAREAPFLAFGASAAVDASTLPSAAAGGSVTLAWTPGPLRIEADARRWVSQSGTLSTATTAGARFSMTSLGGRGCWAVVRAGTFEASPCAGADAHLVSAEGFGSDANFAASGQWAALSAGALGRVTVASWLAARARVEGFVPLARPTFVVENAGPVHRPPVFGVAAALGVEALFP